MANEAYIGLEKVEQEIRKLLMGDKDYSEKEERIRLRFFGSILRTLDLELERRILLSKKEN